MRLWLRRLAFCSSAPVLILHWCCRSLNEELWLFQIETLFGDVAGAVDDPLRSAHARGWPEGDDVALVSAGAQTFAQLRPGGIGLWLLGDQLDMGEQLTGKAGGPLRVVPGDVIAERFVEGPKETDCGAKVFAMYCYTCYSNTCALSISLVPVYAVLV